MPLISDYYKMNGLFNEAEVDGQQIEDQDVPADYTANERDEPPNEGNPQEPPAENQSTAEEPTDYTAAADGEDGGEQPPEEGYTEPPPEEAPVDELKTKEEEMYSNLTPEQLDVKHKELKTRFLDMYDMTTELVDRIGDAIVTEENIGVIEYVSKNLNNLRTMLSDYVSSIYSTKSYIENSINYNRFLAVLNGINKMLEQIHKKEEE